MTKHSGWSPEELRKELVDLLLDFEKKLTSGGLRNQVKGLVPAHYLLWELGSSLISTDKSSARDRILHYLLEYPDTVIEGEELMVVAGISEWARRVRELRVQFGWPIMSGVTYQEMAKEEYVKDLSGQDIANLRPDQYIMLSTGQDLEGAHRWNEANAIRNMKDIGVRARLLKYLRMNVGKLVTGEELRYLAKNRSEWARRVRELRTEFGWPVVTKQTGMPELPVGTYLLEMDRQSHEHDRRISDQTRREVLRRDGYKCQVSECGWHISEYNRADPRILELHHKVHHAEGGSNTVENLITLCNLCHDRVHANSIQL